MGGTAGYCRPVDPTGMASWRAHTNRGTPSTEPGTDYYCPIGTPIRAAASGRIVDVGDSIYPATGHYVTIDLDDGRRVRYLHISSRSVNVGQRVQWGEVIAHSGATGYGEQDWSWNVAETGGAHTHMTLWARQAYTFGRYATLDPEVYMAADQGSGANIIDTALLRRQKEASMYIKGTSQADVYNVWTDANGQVRLRVCLPSEKAYADTGGLTITGYDSFLTQLASDAGYGQKIVPTVAAPGLEVIMIQDGSVITYALWGPGFWDDTEGLDAEVEKDVANGWARVYGNAKNLTYAEWNDRKAVGAGGS